MNYSSSIFKLKKSLFLTSANRLRHYFDCMSCTFCDYSIKSISNLDTIMNSSLGPYINLNNVDAFKKFLRNTRPSYKINKFIANENIAKDIVNKILANTNIKKSLLFEGNAGLGLLTLHLVQSGVHKMYVSEQNELKKFCLLQIMQKYPEVLNEFSDSYQKPGYACFLKSFELAQEHDLVPIFVGVHNNFNFFKLLVNFLKKMNLWNSEFECFSVVTSKMLKCLENYNSKYLKFLPYIALNILCSIQVLEKYPDRAFLPVSNEEDMYLIKVSGNLKNSKIFNEEEHLEYLAFANTLGTNKYGFIIPVLEKWLPDCGPFLISKGISVTTQLADLSPSETVTLFKFFKEHDGYKDFSKCTESFFKENLV